MSPPLTSSAASEMVGQPREEVKTVLPNGVSNLMNHGEAASEENAKHQLRNPRSIPTQKSKFHSSTAL
jgi:hypothetical protein